LASTADAIFNFRQIDFASKVPTSAAEGIATVISGVGRRSESVTFKMDSFFKHSITVIPPRKTAEAAS
jgi:hypothetical protein